MAVHFTHKHVRLIHPRRRIKKTLHHRFNITQKPANKKIEAVNELMFGAKPVNKVIDFFDDLEIVEMPEDEEPKSSYKMFKNQQLSKLREIVVSL